MYDVKHFKKKDFFDKRVETGNHRRSFVKPEKGLQSFSELFPVLLDDGKTVVFTKNKDREQEIRLRYAMRKS